MTWTQQRFLIAVEKRGAASTREVDGYTCKGLGLHLHREASPLGRRPARWHLTHLQSGHLVCILRGDLGTIFPVATEVTDWTFIGIEGWRNSDPDMPKRFFALMAQHPKIIFRPNERGNNEAIARRIAAGRARA